MGDKVGTFLSRILLRFGALSFCREDGTGPMRKASGNDIREVKKVNDEAYELRMKSRSHI